MILVDVYVPALDQIYDFKVEENCMAALLAEEICDMIRQKEQLLDGAEEKTVLFSAESGQALAPDQTLEESGVRDGCRLILV